MWVKRVAVLVALLFAVGWLTHELLFAVREPAGATGSIGPQAVVVLGGGFKADKQAPNAFSISRLERALMLARSYDLPLIISGTEAKAMAASLDMSGVDYTLEGGSQNTCQNARNTAAFLRGQKIKQVYVVSDRYHLPRAVAQFARYDIQAIPVSADLPYPRFSLRAVPVRLYRMGYELAALTRDQLRYRSTDQCNDSRHDS